MKKIIDLIFGDFVVEKRKLSFLAKASDFLILLNIHVLCLDEGFDDFEICYVECLLVMYEFKNKDACKNFLANEVMHH